MAIVRSETEIRELLEAINAICSSRKDCLCFECASEIGTLIAVSDILTWILGERSSEEFYEQEGQEADYDFHFVQALIARFKLGEFELHQKGTSR